MAACGSKVIDSGQAEDQIEQASHGVVSSADCPSGVDADQGKTFECTATFKNGKKKTVTMKIGKVDGDKVQVNIASVKPQA
jgi:NAD(P)H-hydrate repair Nnr-like enzyme with NAD(P)H-hydrate epimerase domain